MDCKVCGAVAPDDAVYCPSCGKRVDGKKTCPKCGRENDESYKFCVRCGTRIDGKKECKNCGLEYEGVFCPQCGVKSVKIPPKAKEVGDRVIYPIYQAIMRILAVSFGLFSAVAAIVFMFFIGFEGDTESTIFYYFKESVNSVEGRKFFQVNGRFFFFLFSNKDFRLLCKFFFFLFIHKINLLCHCGFIGVPDSICPHRLCRFSAHQPGKCKQRVQSWCDCIPSPSPGACLRIVPSCQSVLHRLGCGNSCRSGAHHIWSFRTSFFVEDEKGYR